MSNHDPRFDFRRLKAEVDIHQVLLANHLADGLKLCNQTLMGPCPLHGGDNPTSFRVDLRRGLWHCFAGCGGGDVVDLVRLIKCCTHAQAARYLARIAVDLSQGRALSQPLVVPLAPSSSAFRPFLRCLHLDPVTPFLQDVKGITPLTAERFQAGTPDPSSVFLADTVAVRLHDLDGAPLGYCGRRLRDESIAVHGKWRFPRGFPKSKVLYNAHRARHALSSGIVAVECPWAVMRLAQASVHGAVALLGTSLSEIQAEWLGRAAHILLLLDGDSAGHHAARTIARELAASTRVSVHDLPLGAEPEDLTDSDLSELVSRYLPRVESWRHLPPSQRCT